MLKTLRLLAPFLIATALLPACLPPRDNANDTANRPTAALSLAHGEYDAEAGTCAATDTSSPFSRRECLVVSAEATTDPQDDVVKYVFELTTSTTAGNLTVLHFEESDAASVMLAPDVLRTYPPDTPIDVRVTVLDENGGVSGETGRFVLQNTAPVVIRPGSRYVPNFGAIWDRTNGKVGGPLTVRLSASAVDAEEDPLEYCWQALPFQSDGAGEDVPPHTGDCSDFASFACDGTDSELITVVASSLEGQGVKSVPYMVQACDGTLWSTPTNALIQLDLLPGWGVENDFNDAFALDTELRSYEIEENIRGLPAFFFRNDGDIPARAVYGWDDPGTPLPEGDLVKSVLVGDSSAGFVDVMALPGSVAVRAALAVEPGEPPSPAFAPYAWVLAGTGSAGIGVYVVDTAGNSAGPFMPDPPIFAAGSQTVLAEVDPNTGDLWFSSTFSSHVIGVEYTGTISGLEVISIPDDAFGHPRMVTGLSLRPGAVPQGALRRLTITHAAHVLVPGDAEDAALLVRREDGSLEDWSFEVPETLAQQHSIDLGSAALAGAVNRQVVYVNFFGSGIALVGLDEQNKLGRLLGFTPANEIGFHYGVHPKTQRMMMAAGSGHGVLRVSLSGEFSQLESDRRIAAIYPDETSGRLAVYFPPDPGELPSVVAGSGTSTDGILQRFAIPPAFNRSRPGIDYSSGDLWTPSVLPAGASRFYSDGRLADFIEAVDPENDGVGPFPGFGAALRVAPDPATGALWMVTVQDTSGSASTIFRVDPYGDRPDGAPTVVAGGGITGHTFPNETILDIAAQPTLAGVDSSGSLVVLTRTFANQYRLRRVFRDGSEAAPVNLLSGGPSFPEPVLIARDLASTTEDVCVAVRTGSSQIRLYRPTGSLVAASGPQTLLSGLTDTSLLALGAFHGECWLAYQDSFESKLVLWRPNDFFDPLVTLTLPGRPSQVVPEIAGTTFAPNARRVWLTFPDEAVLRRVAVKIPPMSAPFLEIRETVEARGSVMLLSP